MPEKREPNPVCIQVEDDVLWDLHAVAKYLGRKPGSINDMMYRKERREGSLLPAPLSDSIVAMCVNGAGYHHTVSSALIELTQRFNLRFWSAKSIIEYRSNREAARIVDEVVGG